MAGSDSDRLDHGLKNLLDRAIELDQRGMKNEACQKYLKASKILIKLANSASLPSVRKHLGCLNRKDFSEDLEMTHP